MEYFDVQSKGGQIILTPVRIQRADAVLAYPKFKLSDGEQHELLADCLPWCATVRVAE